MVNREEYYPFGETSFGSYSKKRYRFCGKEKDEESGLYYYGARYYSPWTCRFVSVDPLAGKYPFYTAYQYAGNQPINFIDLDGLEQAPVKDTSDGAAPTPSVSSTKSETKSIEEPIVNGKQAPYSDDFVKEQKAIAKKEAKIKTEKLKKEKDNLKQAELNKNPANYYKFMLKITGNALSKSISKMKSTSSVSQSSENQSSENKTSDELTVNTKAIITAAKKVIANYKENKTKYSQPNREFGLDVEYADCSSTIYTILQLAGQTSIIGEGKSTESMQDYIKTLPTNNSIREGNPLPGDLMMWGGHVAIVLNVMPNGKVEFAMMGSSGGAIYTDTQEKIKENKGKNHYGTGKFLGYWTPK